MRPIADYHTHTKFSDGKGTVEENVLAAREKGLREVGIADHGPAGLFLGVKPPEKFLEIKRLARECSQKYPDICVKAGVEANILDIEGQLDVPPKISKELDQVLVGFHLQILPPTFKGLKEVVFDNLWTKLVKKGQASAKLRNNNTKASVEAVCRNRVNIFTHPGLHIAIDTKELARACARRETALEINCRHVEEAREFVDVGIKEGAHFVLSSDAHRPEDVGNLAEGIKVVEDLQIPSELVLNLEK